MVVRGGVVGVVGKGRSRVVVGIGVGIVSFTM